jgi:uncharacterized membrane protein YphA (DoxX/SURF4 family)
MHLPQHDPITRTTILPLILRLTLAAIFIYHGVGKISGRDNDWGASWATDLWVNQGKAPQPVLDQLDRSLADHQAVEMSTQEEIKRLEEAAKKLTDPKDKEQKEQNEQARQAAEQKLKTNHDAQEEIRKAKERIKVAFAHAAGNPPEALTYAGIQLAVAWGELLCGIALLLGVLTRLAAAGIIVIMIGAIWAVTGAHGFSAAGGGYEYNLAIVAMCAALIIKGPGPVSLDGELASLRRTKAAAQQQQPVAV